MVPTQKLSSAIFALALPVVLIGIVTAENSAAETEDKTVLQAPDDAPISFLPVCKPRQFHLFSRQHIRCACGLKCRFACAVNGEKKRICRRVCMQKPCFRPAVSRVYDYRLVGGLCQRWRMCQYRAKCAGRTRRWIQYHPIGCQNVNPYERLANYFFSSYMSQVEDGTH
ncbi:hypothetical protein CSKR_100341 [Clonorchis sinensis]|uniref:Uncharacterized protein n=1 Tax=Clonorchis sinensis TaxID=79923 RepID=A0A3R7CR95_CLOSI|nr:hypothetical protein CSKR_100341 [Clonorchis sinensis]